MKVAVILLGIFTLYLCVDLGRVFKRRINKEYLRHAWKKTAIWLLGMQLAVIFITYVSSQLQVSIAFGIYLIATAQALIGITIFTTTLNNLRKVRSGHVKLLVSEKDLPTVTVCIPARNETQDLLECLQSLVSSTYPKLEILVLDDCSQERRTSEIIRCFAQQGVRFIAGKNPPDKWLAKNYGYDQMADEANGDFLLFCGVDSRFQPDTITQLVKLMLQNKRSMLSVIPKNVLKPGLSFGQSLIQPSRYAWELALPRDLAKRPPVLSTCWIITKQTLAGAGGFEAISKKTVPESYFVRLAAKQGDYSFITSNSLIGLTCTKSIAEQRSTAIRTRYPQLHRRPELVALVSLAELTQLVLPIIFFVTSILTSNVLLFSLSTLSMTFNLLAYSKIVNLTYRRFLVAGLFALPVAAIYDICLLNYSMWQYEFGEVVWKDRNICVPVMQVIPELPKI